MKGFREGWAVKGSSAIAHYFRRQGVGIARSLCGSQDAPAGWLLAAGQTTCCERCARIRDGEVAKQAEKSTGDPQSECGHSFEGDGGDCA